MDSLDPHLDTDHTVLSDSDDEHACSQSTAEMPPPSHPTDDDSVKRSSSTAQYLRPSKAIQNALKCWQWLGRRIGAANPIAAFVIVAPICVELTVISGRALFLYGILLVLLLQISQVAEPWIEYVGSDPDIRNMLTFIRGWRRFFGEFIQRHNGRQNTKQDPDKSWWHWW